MLKTIQLFVVNIALTIFCGCSHVGNNDNIWSPKTDLLDKFGKENLQMTGFAHDVEGFYENLHDKKWLETYKQRSKEFHQDFSEELYLKTANERAWELQDYEVLSVKAYDTNKVVLICKFKESPLIGESYNTVTWTIEEGVWKCDCAGPVGLGIFPRTRAPKF